jgi:hypothetical protein
MMMGRKKLVLAAAACVVMTPLPIVTGMGNESPARLAALFGDVPFSIWMGLIIMAALVIAAWLSIDADDGETHP